jgi:long-subunit fatty acid transport protein
MKKILLATAFTICVASAGFGQTQHRQKLSVGMDVGLPVGNSSDWRSIAVGGSLKYEVPVISFTALTLSAGYASFVSKTVSNYKAPAFKAIVIKGGIKPYINNNIYGEAQAGIAFHTRARLIGGGATANSAFVYAMGFGYDFGKTVDIGLRYERWAYNGGGIYGNLAPANAPLGQIALRFAFTF